MLLSSTVRITPVQKTVPRSVSTVCINTNIEENEEELIPGQVYRRFRFPTNQSADSRMTGRPHACAVAPFWYQEYGSVLMPVGEIRCN